MTTRLMEQQENEERATRQVQSQKRANEQRRMEELRSIWQIKHPAATPRTSEGRSKVGMNGIREKKKNRGSQSREESPENELKRGLQIMGEEDETPKEATSLRPKEHRGPHHPKNNP